MKISVMENEREFLELFKKKKTIHNVFHAL